MDADTPINDSSPVVFDLATSGSLKLTHGRRSATLRGSGLRSVTMSTGAGGTGKTVVYTDVELSRGVVEHYLPGQNATRLAVDSDFGDLDVDNEIPQTSGDWKISHGFRTSIDGTTSNGDVVAATAPAAKSNTSYGGSLHGVSGRFVCTGTNCRVQVDPMYSTPSDGDISLQSVMLNSVNAQGEEITDGAVHFVSSGSISLYVGGPVEEDKNYMVFGYWREDPASPSGVYKFDVFADVIGTQEGTVPNNITANYDGTAVGAYAEKDPGTAVETWRQGEFTADVDLTASRTGVYGTIDDFVTTPTGGSTAPKTAGRWRVDLGSATALTAPNTDTGVLHLPQMAGSQTDGDGTWAHAFVSSRPSGGVPPTVAGTFKASIKNSLTLVGAFGAQQ